MPHSLILCTASSEEEAGRIARHLVEKRLAACVSISANHRSIYRWEGELCETQEWQLLIKAKSTRYLEIEDEIRALHSYDVPEIIALPVESGLLDYLQWIDTTTI